MQYQPPQQDIIIDQLEQKLDKWLFQADLTNREKKSRFTQRFDAESDKIITKMELIKKNVNQSLEAFTLQIDNIQNRKNEEFKDD